MFFAVTAGALVFYLWIARHAWFEIDEWDFLADRSAGSVSDLLRPHNEHWSTLPILLWRGLFHVFGLRTYTPYLLVLLLAHLTLAYLLRVVMLRAGVRPWTATAAASLFVLFGAGAEDILWAFQIGFVASLVLGVIQLLLADHAGPIGRRDGLAVASGLAALLCSGLGVTMAVVVGLAVLLRRGVRAAALQTVPLAAVYFVWFGAYGHRSYQERTVPSRIPTFIGDVVWATFRGLGQVPGLGIVLAGVLLVGLYLAWSGRSRQELRESAAVPFALLVGSLVFIFVTSLGRAGVAEQALFRVPVASPRYIYVAAALVLPALAVAVDTLSRRFGTWGIVLPLLFLVAIPGNIEASVNRERGGERQVRELKLLMLSAAHLPISQDLPRDYVPVPVYGGTTTVGWLRSNAAAGRVPSPGPMSPTEVATVSQQLVLQPLTLTAVPSGCRPLDVPATLTPAKGQSVLVQRQGKAQITYLPSSGHPPGPAQFGTDIWITGFRFVVGGLRFDVRADSRGQVLVCR